MKKLLLTAAACAVVTCLAASAQAATTATPAPYLVAKRDGPIVTYALASPAELDKGAAIARVVEPEVSGWAMAMLSFAGLGAALRAARQRLLRSVNTYAF